MVCLALDSRSYAQVSHQEKQSSVRFIPDQFAVDGASKIIGRLYVCENLAIEDLIVLDWVFFLVMGRTCTFAHGIPSSIWVPSQQACQGPLSWLKYMRRLNLLYFFKIIFACNILGIFELELVY